MTETEGWRLCCDFQGENTGLQLWGNKIVETKDKLPWANFGFFEGYPLPTVMSELILPPIKTFKRYP